MTEPQRARSAGLPSDPTWYKDAIIYELRTRSFFDSNGDGIGDFRGLTSKLGYLQDLGVTALWLLPFYPSPGRDDGYDISDYTGVHPDLGTLADFEEFLHEAHRRGIRVITELVLNHTSDQHPWFQRARRAPAGSPERDMYVWSKTAEPYREARIIFQDFEPSNWSWDSTANAHYWHRFYSHQPDLNFENPAVHDAMLEIVDFWFGLGVDGLRLDAVPYLYEADGTSCENLPPTHAFLKKLRAHVDANFEDRMLLAEANQWPEDAAAYFGQGDECHMNFHFPLMPRMFLSIHAEDRFPIVDIFAQTPTVDDSCQWALFLRNHDELTLEMVTDEERESMYRAYGSQKAMRVNLGIRRRLAPLVGNSRRKIELLNGLLFSLPGTPVLYYGDEIGMGDNVYLGDRNGVRTPMQWSMDRNAGFSSANPQQLILPVIIDPEYHYETLNVENQQQNPNSLLWWTKRLIDLRKQFAAFGRGTIEFLSPKNPHVLAFVRAHGAETVLIVANLSRFVQYAELDLAARKGAVPVELFGKTTFPPIGDAPYVVTLGPHEVYWFSLDRPDARIERLSRSTPPPAITATSIDALFANQRASLDFVLPAFLGTRSWFAERHDALVRTQIIDAMPTPLASLRFAFVRAEYRNAEPETFVLPLAAVAESSAGSAVAIARLSASPDAPASVLVDAVDDVDAARALLSMFGDGAMPKGSALAVTREGGHRLTADQLALTPRTIGRGRVTSQVQYGDELVLQIFRRLEEGICPELEIGRHLSSRPGDLAPPLLGAIELRQVSSEPKTLAILHGYVPHVGTARDLVRDELGRYYDRVLTLGNEDLTPSTVAKTVGAFRDTAARLGARVAELHRALATHDRDPAFAPEPYTALERRSKYQSLRNLGGSVLRLLSDRMTSLAPRAQREATALLARERELFRAFEPIHKSKLSALRIRTHGNLHLGNVLHAGKAFVFVGFNGYPELTFAERRRKRSAARDLAWMARSFELAAYNVLFDPSRVRESDVDAALPWAEAWATTVTTSFLDAYLTAIAGESIVPADRSDVTVLFDAFALERALYQLRAALTRQPDVLVAAVFGLRRMLAAS